MTSYFLPNVIILTMWARSMPFSTLSTTSIYYSTAFDTLMYHRNAYSGYNMFITRWEHFDGYSEWLFKVLFELEKRVKLSGYPDQARLFGYLSERLINIYCIRNRLKVKYIPVIMPLDEAFRNPGNLRYTLRRLKNDLIYKLTKV